MPIDIISTLTIIISTLISVSILGLVAGFSPTLYVAQITIAAKVKRPIAYATSLMGGVLVALLLLIILFQVIQLDALLAFIDTTIRAVILSVVFNMLIGVGFVITGIWYLRHKETPKPPKPSKVKKTGGLISVFGLGFVRTFISISGVTATFFAANIIANIGLTLIEQAVFTIVFFGAAVVPFIGIVIYMKKSPERLIKATNQVHALLRRVNYRPVVGAGAIILGGSILIFNLMMVLFY